MEKSNSKISLLDINHSAFLNYHGKEPELTLQGTRVIFNYEATPEVYQLINLYHQNPEVRVLDFVHVLRKLRAMMLAMKNVKGGEK